VRPLLLTCSPLQAANAYFFIIGVLQLFPSISTTGGLPTTWAPLAFVYLVSLAREVFEESSRRSEQIQANQKQRASVLRPGAKAFVDVAWQDVQVGDIVRVENEQLFPCDMILLGSVHGGDEEDASSKKDIEGEESAKAQRAKQASCHVDTASLDGESNLKKFVAASALTADLVQSETKLIGSRIRLKYGPSMADLAKFEGTLLSVEVPRGDGSMTALAIPDGGVQLTASTKGNTHTLLRECKLRSCERAYGLCIYTGGQTFIKQQAKKTQVKPVFLSEAINRFVIIMLAIQTLLCLGGSIGFSVFALTQGGHHWYLSLQFQGVDFIARFATYFQITSNFIPISLYVSMELARLIQRFLMESDDDMLFVTTNPDEPNIPTKVRSLQLNDQLGQVTHIFSDKTGTLTRNSFEFRKISVGGYSYGAGTTEIAVIAARGRARTVAERQAAQEKQVLLERGLEAMRKPGKIPHVLFLEDDDATKFQDAIRCKVPVVGPGGVDIREDHAEDLDEFLTSLILNSTVGIEHSDKDGPAGGHVYKLAGDSSDEVCFGYGAYSFGYKLIRRGFTSTGLPTYEIEAPPPPGSPPDAPPRRIVRHLLHVNEFNSARGMMSVVIEDPTKPEDAPDRVTVYAKGSDKMIRKCLYPIPDFAAMAAEAEKTRDAEKANALRLEALRHATQASMRGKTIDVCGEWSEDGFRTLAFAYRRMSVAEFLAWRPRLKEARDKGKELYDEHLAKHPDDESGAEKLKKEEIAKATAEIERDLVWHGVVGYEDSLQEGVPDTIARLGDAGIRVYMLTGDKEGTAVNIGFGVQMLTNETEILRLTYEGREKELFGDSSKRAKALLAGERRQLQDLINAFQKGSSAVDSDEEGGREEGGPRGSMPMSTTPGTGSSRKGEFFEKPSDTSGAMAVASPGDAPSAPAPEEGAIDLTRLVRLGEPPMMQEAVKLLTPHRNARGEIDQVALTRASVVAKALVMEVNRAISRLEDYLSGAITDEAEAAKVRQDVVFFVLTIDAVLFSVRYQGGTSKPLALILDDRSMWYFLDWPGYAEIRSNPAGFDPTALEQKTSKRLALLALMEQCNAIIGARCQPSQKRIVLELIKEEVPGACCLAIGDGANDVEMISAGNVGVGIKGVEGNSAANAADYAIGQFRFLQRLLLVHGRWNYRRMCILILFLFYKNALFSLAQFLFGSLSGWSGQKLYGEVANQTFNLFLTGMGILAVAVLDQDVDQDSAQRFPALYSDGRERRLFNPRLASMWLLNAGVEGAIVFVFCIVTMGVSSGNAYTNSVFELGATAMSVVIAVVNIRLAMETFQHEALMVAFSILGTASWPALAFAGDAIDLDNTFGMMARVFNNPVLWLLIPVAVVVVMFPVISTKIILALNIPSYSTIVRETEFFVRRGFQSTQFAPMVETADTRRLRQQKRLTKDARTLERAAATFDRSNAVTKITVGVDSLVARSINGVVPAPEGEAKEVSTRPLPARAGALEQSIVVSAGNSNSVALVRRAKSRQSPASSRVRAHPAASPAAMRGLELKRIRSGNNLGVEQGGLSGTASSLGGHRAASAVPGLGKRRWQEQEAALILWPIEESLKAKLAAEERTRLAYPYYFHLGAAMRKRMANLVQQGRVPAESIGLRPFPDDDIVLGAGADTDKGAVKSMEETVEASSMALGRWDRLRRELVFSSKTAKDVADRIEHENSLREDREKRWAVSRQGHRKARSHLGEVVSGRGNRAEFTVDEAGVSRTAEFIEGQVGRALERMGHSLMAMPVKGNAHSSMMRVKSSPASYSAGRIDAKEASAAGAAAEPE
jgi:magnesium-transporting ATPase (P-type)